MSPGPKVIFSPWTLIPVPSCLATSRSVEPIIKMVHNLDHRSFCGIVTIFFRRGQPSLGIGAYPLGLIRPLLRGSGGRDQNRMLLDSHAAVSPSMILGAFMVGLSLR